MVKIADSILDSPRCRYDRRERNRSRSRWIVVIALFLLAVYTLRQGQGTWFPFDIRKNQKTTTPFSWDNLPTKRYLDYVDCYDGEFQCARLEVPMDYWNGTTDATVSLAIIKKPAVVSVTHPQYGGASLHNPGGPGGSGVFFLRGAAEALRGVIDSKDGIYFDLISFDPRGIGHTTPNVRCFTDPMLDQSWQLRVMEEGVFGASDAALGRLWSMSIARGQGCSLPPRGDAVDIKKYVSTAYVARDMLEIVERHGEWREKEAQRLVPQGGNCHSTRSVKNSPINPQVPEALKHKPGEERINYWGFSYGSYLGNTFAAMYPDRINRLIVDGVVDAYDYKKSLWFDNLVDAEKDMDLFYYHCARVGFPMCTLANQTGPTTAAAVEQRTQSIIESLYHNPLPVISPVSPEVISYSDVKGFILAVLYTPVLGFPYLANMMFEIERGDGTEFAKLLRLYHSFDCPAQAEKQSSIIPLRDRSEGGAGAVSVDAQMAIACSDGDDQSWLTKPAFQEHIKNLTKLSPSIGEIWATLRMTCVHYTVRPQYRFEGPWVGNTSHPILEIGNSADPVTPGRYAKKMAEGFTGAVALIQDSAGHCSLSTPSKCTEQYVRQYFQTGKLPPLGTICEADAIPFGPGPGESEIIDAESLQIRTRQRTIAHALFAAGGGFLSRGIVGGLDLR